MAKSVVGLLLLALLPLTATPADAAGLVRARTESAVDWVSKGVGGVPAGTANIVLSGVSGTVEKAYLYWGGMHLGGGAFKYENPTISVNGQSVTGTSLGDTSSNCWGTGGSRAYVADVSSIVTGNGTYALTGLQSLPAYQVNGASLVVVFDDDNPTNDHDLIFYEGNDSTDFLNFTGIEDGGWHAQLTEVPYRGGMIRAQFHVADGQSVGAGSDGDVTLQASADDILVIPNTTSLFDGKSVPMQGTSRSPGDALWDIHTFDITTLFDSEGTTDIALTSPPLAADCIALIAVILELQPEEVGPGGPAVCGDGVVAGSEACDDGNLIDGDCCDAHCAAEPATIVCGTAGDPCLESRCDGHGRCDTELASCRMPVAARAGRLVMKHGRKDQLLWKWAEGVSSKGDFGNPAATTAYDLCLYDKGAGSVRLLRRISLTPGPTWAERPDGFEYRSPGGALQSLRLKGAAPGRASIVAKSAGGTLELPDMPVLPPVLVRLRAANGACWGVNYSAPRRNTPRRFTSKGDDFYVKP
jgi:cysteine-rich repeat protein